MIRAIIQARLNSTRLPGKVLRELRGRSVLGHVVDRVRAVKSIDDIVVSTCERGGGSIAAHCDSLEVEWFIDRKSAEDDVLSRFIETMRATQTKDDDLIVRVCADSPLLEPMLADELIAEAVESGADYTGYRVGDQWAVSIPNGLTCEVALAQALRRLNSELSTDAPEREHVTMGLYRSGRYLCRAIDAPGWYHGEHYGLDTEMDFQRLEAEEVLA